VTAFGHTTIHGAVSEPGRYLLRSHYSPYLRLGAGTGCVRRAPGSMTWLELKRAGPFVLSVPASADGLFDALTARHHGSC
jgi:hypothetical protein